MKTKEELDVMKHKLDEMRRDLRALSDEELEYVSGGTDFLKAEIKLRGMNGLIGQANDLEINGQLPSGTIHL